MSTSMLDALAAEAKEITLLGAEASRLAIDALRRSNLLTQQIQRLAAEEGAAPPSISADADDAAFLAFQAEHFPDVVFGAGNQNSNSPGDPPAIQIGGQGNQGSGEVAPGGASACVQAQPEQASADTVSGEQGLTVVCKDPETGPDTNLTLKDRVLDRYATTLETPTAIAAEFKRTPHQIRELLREARKKGDRRVAAGDYERAPKSAPEPAQIEVATREPAPLTAPAERQALAIPDGLRAVEQKPGLTMAIDEDPKEGNLLALNASKVTAAFRGQGIQLARHEWRLLLKMNDQQPKSPEQMLQFAGVLQQRRLRSEVSKLNARLALIDVEIHFDDVSYTLRPLQVA